MNVRGRPTDPGAIYVGPDDFRAYEQISIEASGGDLPCRVELTASIDRGTYVVDELRCTRKRGGPEISGEIIRSVPVTRILQAGALRANRSLRPTMSPAEYQARRGEGPTERNLRTVALIYRMARLVREDPTVAVVAAFDLPKPTASRWVQMARARGFLGPAERRKAGER